MKKITSPKKRSIFSPLDSEEKDLMKSIEQEEWVSVKNVKKEILEAQHAASHYLRKAARINIRISEADLDQIKQKAAYEGLPYQTLISSILHKFAAGHL